MLGKYLCWKFPTLKLNPLFLVWGERGNFQKLQKKLKNDKYDLGLEILKHGPNISRAWDKVYLTIASLIFAGNHAIFKTSIGKETKVSSLECTYLSFNVIFVNGNVAGLKWNCLYILGKYWFYFKVWFFFFQFNLFRCYNNFLFGILRDYL